MNERRMITISDLRALAIKEEWFTLADNDTYSQWLNLGCTADNLTTDLIVELSQMVIDNSDIPYDDDLLCSICFMIAQSSYTIFKK